MSAKVDQAYARSRVGCPGCSSELVVQPAPGAEWRLDLGEDNVSITYCPFCGTEPYVPVYFHWPALVEVVR